MADRKLKTYQEKRDFAVTSEPGGEAQVAPSERLRFVVQKHAARRLHYDLRLEYDGVFKSWAVTRGPSLDPQQRRLAVEVEDHPLDYGDFEGTIPKGEYGGGAVMIWDRGFWAPEGSMSIEQQLKKGHLEAVFSGQRMKGAWHLVRIERNRERSARTNWLLIKAHDAFERDDPDEAFLEDNETSVASGRSMEQIAAGRGKGPKPFMLAGGKAAPAAAVWTSNRLGAPDADPVPAPRHGPKVSALPGFVSPQQARPCRPPA